MVRIKKPQAIKFISKLYGKRMQPEEWGNNHDIKLSFRAMSIEAFKNTHIQADLKSILTPVHIHNNDPLPLIQVPPRISDNVALKRYQLYNVDWMLNIERNLDAYSINVPTTHEIIPNIHFDHTTDIIYRCKQGITISPPHQT